MTQQPIRITSRHDAKALNMLHMLWLEIKHNKNTGTGERFLEDRLIEVEEFLNQEYKDLKP